DVAVVDRCGAVVVEGADEQEDRDRGPRTRSERLPALSARLFTRGPSVAAENEHVDRGELVGEGLADASGGVAVDPAAVGDEADDAFVADAVGGPADGAHVGVVEAVLVDRVGAGG